MDFVQLLTPVTDDDLHDYFDRLRELANTVLEMRKNQLEYFKSRQGSTLINAKKLEKEVDKQLIELVKEANERRLSHS